MENYESRPSREEYLANTSGKIITGVTNVTLTQELVGFYEKQLVNKRRVIELKDSLAEEIFNVKQAVCELGNHFPSLRQPFLNSFASSTILSEDLTPEEKEVIELGRKKVRKNNITWQRMVRNGGYKPEHYLQLPSDYVFPTIPLSNIDKVVYVRGVVSSALRSVPVSNVTRDSFITEIISAEREQLYGFLRGQQELSYVKNQKIRNLFFTTHVLKQIGLKDEQIYSWMISDDPYKEGKNRVVNSLVDTPQKSAQLLNTVLVTNNYHR